MKITRIILSHWRTKHRIYLIHVDSSDILWITYKRSLHIASMVFSTIQALSDILFGNASNLYERKYMKSLCILLFIFNFLWVIKCTLRTKRKSFPLQCCWTRYQILNEIKNGASVCYASYSWVHPEKMNRWLTVIRNSKWYTAQ